MTNRFCALVLTVIFAPATFGHHSAAEYGVGSESEELQGEVLQILWRNPHVTLLVNVESADGREAVWEMESFAATTLNRRGFSRDSIAVGDQVRVLGWASNRREHQMLITEAVVGTELAFTTDRNGAADEEFAPESVAASRDRAEGIFRVWDPARGSRSGWPNPLPLTDAAESVRQLWDPYVDDAAKRCVPPGMPRAMFNNGLPIEFVDDGEAILLHLEEFDSVRTIHKTTQPRNNQEPATPLGYSIGWWEDRTLVVHTTRINYPYFDRDGIPQSDQVEIVERFTLSDDDAELGYHMTLSDPATFTEPVDTTRRWIWRPGRERRDYDCAFIE